MRFKLISATALMSVGIVSAYTVQTVPKGGTLFRSPHSQSSFQNPNQISASRKGAVAAARLYMLATKQPPDQQQEQQEKSDDSDKTLDSSETAAVTGTVNERLMAELQAASKKEKFGTRSPMGEKLSLFGSFRSSKTDEERQAAIEEARDLNGVNPIIALTGSVVALGGAYGLWMITNVLAEYFALNPVSSDIYFIQRVSSVFRNVVMGFFSLASGFFGVTGLGIFLLGVRVSYGVITGELDPTPIPKKNASPELEEIPNVWDLMMNKKPGRGRR
jgi:hypothetical protein